MRSPVTVHTGDGYLTRLAFLVPGGMSYEGGLLYCVMGEWGVLGVVRLLQLGIRSEIIQILIQNLHN